MLLFFHKTFIKKPNPKVFEQQYDERSPDWYDKSFTTTNHWKYHYTKSPYYFLWTVIVDRLKSNLGSNILEIGSGSGQMASFLRDKGFKTYKGIDFSRKGVEYSRRACKEFSFYTEDVFTSSLLYQSDYEIVLCLEFLEHVRNDTSLLQNIRSGVRFIGTVPNFPFASHVRYFRNEQEVYSRYSKFFTNFTVDYYPQNDTGTIFFLLDGIKQ